MKKALPLGLLALTLALAACGPTTTEGSGSDSKGTESSSVAGTEGSQSSSKPEETTDSGSSSTTPPAPTKGWTDEEKAIQAKYLGEGVEIPYIDLSPYAYEFVDYENYFSIEVAEAPYSIVLDYRDILIEEGYVEDTPETAGKGEKLVYDYQDGYHIEYDLYCTDENWAYNEISGLVSIDVFKVVYNATYPQAELDAWLAQQGIEGAGIPDFSVLPSENWASGTATDYFAIVWNGPNDEATVEDVAKVLTDAGWTLDALQGGYVNEDGKVVVAVGTTTDGTVAINILLPLPTTIPLDEINEALASLYGIDPIEIPGYPGEAAYEIDTSLIWIGYFSVNVWTDGDAATWAETLEEAGWTTETDEYGDINCTDPTEAIVMILTDATNGIMVSFEVPTAAWPTEEIQTHMANLGAENVVLPDLTEIGITGISVYDDQEENPGMIQIVISSDYGWYTDVQEIYLAEGWTENTALGGYVDPTETVYAVIGATTSYDILINVYLMPELLTEWPGETFGAEVKAWFSEILVADAGTLDLPAPVIANEDAAYLIANDGYSPVLSVMGITQDEVDGYIDDLVEAGLVDTGLAGLFTGGYACLADEVSDIVLILYYDAASETLTICSDALTYFYKWDASYVASLLYYCYIEDTVTLPAIDGYCYVDESMLDYYGMFGIYAPGDITGTYGEALTAAGWTYDADIEMWSNESAGLFLEYDAEADITSITIIGPYGI